MIQSHLDRIECVGQRVNAMVTVMVDTALADAAVTERADAATALSLWFGNDLGLTSMSRRR